MAAAIFHRPIIGAATKWGRKEKDNNNQKNFKNGEIKTGKYSINLIIQTTYGGETHEIFQ